MHRKIHYKITPLNSRKYKKYTIARDVINKYSLHRHTNTKCKSMSTNIESMLQNSGQPFKEIISTIIIYFHMQNSGLLDCNLQMNEAIRSRHPMFSCRKSSGQLYVCKCSREHSTGAKINQSSSSSS